ncbi:hypothetical protein J132_10231 [Termitomyces sp. J132]|nr:hypothetical protein J132_10231 [Termitomyces sp. J132]
MHLSWTSGGMPSHHIHQLYNIVAVPAITHVADVWYTCAHDSPSGKKRLSSVRVTNKLLPSQC